MGVMLNVSFQMPDPGDNHHRIQYNQKKVSACLRPPNAFREKINDVDWYTLSTDRWLDL